MTYCTFSLLEDFCVFSSFFICLILFISVECINIMTVFIRLYTTSGLFMFVWIQLSHDIITDKYYIINDLAWCFVEKLCIFETTCSNGSCRFSGLNFYFWNLPKCQQFYRHFLRKNLLNLLLIRVIFGCEINTPNWP